MMTTHCFVHKRRMLAGCLLHEAVCLLQLFAVCPHERTSRTYSAAPIYKKANSVSLSLYQ